MRAASSRLSRRLVPTSITVAPGGEIIAGDHGRPADGRHQDVGLAAHGGKVGRLGVADGDRGVLVQQQQGHGLADDVAAAHHHGALAGDGNPVALQQFEDARRRAGARSRQSGHEVAHVAGMEAVDIFLRSDRQQDALAIHLRRQRKLHQDAVDFRPRVQLRDDVQQIGGR